MITKTFTNYCDGPRFSQRSIFGHSLLKVFQHFRDTVIAFIGQEDYTYGACTAWWSEHHYKTQWIQCETLRCECSNINLWEITKHCYHILVAMGPERDCIGVDQNPTWSQPLPLFPVGSALWNSVSTSANTWTGFKDLSQTSHLQKNLTLDKRAFKCVNI